MKSWRCWKPTTARWAVSTSTWAGNSIWCADWAWSLKNRKKVVFGAVALLAASLTLFPLLGKEFMPQLKEGSIMWRVTSIPSTSLDESIEVSKKIENALSEFPEVNTTIAMIGRAEKGETADVNYMEIYTELKPHDEWASDRSFEELADAMRETLEAVVPTTVIAFTQPIQIRVEELISGVRATLATKLYGEELRTLDRLSQKIKDVIAEVPGVADLFILGNARTGNPHVGWIFASDISHVIPIDEEWLDRHFRGY